MRETSSQPKTADGDASRRVLGEGDPLPTAVRGRMETAFGQSLSSVQLHRGPEAAGAADRIGARAFAGDDHIGFAAGEYPQQPDFTPADLKAMLGNETGDYSNTNIAGLEKTTGVTGGPENPSFVGVGQIGTDAMSSLRANAPRLGLALPARGDPRGNPQQGILLAAAYLRLTADTLARRLPPPVPTGTEFKKMLMAAYNGGPGHVVAMANGYRAEVPGTDPYGWNDIKDQGKLPKPTARKDYRKEMKNYVQGWEDRVAP